LRDAFGGAFDDVDAAIDATFGSRKANEHFSVEAAIRYLETRDVPTLAAALSYIRQPLARVQTPLRAAINAHAGRKDCAA
jgi:hypothetical protein